MPDLSAVPLIVLSKRAHALARRGELPGVTALALIVWPDPDDMDGYLLATRVAHADRLKRRRRRYPDERVPPEIRLRHSYREAVEGFCEGFVDLGVRWRNRVRCSRRAYVGRYCRTHAKKIAA